MKKRGQRLFVRALVFGLHADAGRRGDLGLLDQALDFSDQAQHPQRIHRRMQGRFIERLQEPIRITCVLPKPLVAIVPQVMRSQVKLGRRSNGKSRLTGNARSSSLRVSRIGPARWGHAYWVPVVIHRENLMAQAQPPPVYPNAPKKPWKVTVIGVLRIGSGLCNIGAGLFFWWLYLPTLLILLGIAEIISGGRMLNAKPMRPSSPKSLAIYEILSILTLAGWIPLVVGILSLI